MHIAPYKMFYLIIHIKSPVGMIRLAETFCINARFYLQFRKDTGVLELVILVLVGVTVPYLWRN